MTKRLPRLKFKCWQCNRTYTLMPNEITEKQELIVPCPYCEAEARVKVEPFKKEKKTVLKTTGAEELSLGFEYDFPEVIPTEKPEE